ncbi:MAG: hypothetical protein HQK51_13165 [Oligoflexia bacterium]|nr:hypothetical protein [Oligoflexia bacterium]
MAVISLILFVNNLGQKFLREQMAKDNITIPNQLGKQTTHHTLKGAIFYTIM